MSYVRHKRYVFTGLFGNVKLNQRINELDWLDEIYIYPAMNDSGLALGGTQSGLTKVVEKQKDLKIYFGIWTRKDELMHSFFVENIIFWYEKIST